MKGKKTNKRFQDSGDLLKPIKEENEESRCLINREHTEHQFVESIG